MPTDGIAHAPPRSFSVLVAPTLPRGPGQVTTAKAIQVKLGSITRETTGAIVNPANGLLRHGGGAALAIATAAGRALEEQSRAVVAARGELRAGEAAITGAGELPCAYVIHAVGPYMGQGDETRLLARAVRSALQLADGLGLKSVSMPAISSGIFGFPKAECAAILIETAVEWLTQPGGTSLETIVMCNHDIETCQRFLEAARSNPRLVEGSGIAPP